MTTMKEIKLGRIQILTEQEIHELYSRACCKNDLSEKHSRYCSSL